jgi:hypothetical protein
MRYDWWPMMYVVLNFARSYDYRVVGGTEA